MKWQKITISTGPASQEQGIAPEVISASRATDLPAFHAHGFMEALRRGYCVWTNPFNSKQRQYVSFARVKAIVFWSKNPEPLLKYLPEIDSMRIKYYFQYTLNDYKAEGFEPCVPSLKQRMLTFMELSRRLGKNSVIWRFDPLLLTGTLSVDLLIRKIKNIGDILHPYTSKLVFSFADIGKYRKVERSLKRAQIHYKEWQQPDMAEAAEKIAVLCQGWGITPATCGEQNTFNHLGIQKNKCVDDQLLLSITNNAPELLRLYGRTKDPQQIFFDEGFKSDTPSLKDSGQREECGCVRSKDIGMYNTCSHFCVYCYANTPPEAVMRNREGL